MAEEPKRLYRRRKGRKLVGVLGGVANYTGLDPSLIRIAYVILTILTGFIPGIFLYLVMGFIVPLEPKAESKSPAD